MTVANSARLALASASLALLAIPAVGRDAPAGSLRLTGAWSRPTPPGAPAAAGYVTITNTGTRPDRLLGATSTAAERIEVHEMKLTNGIMQMRPVAGGLAIAPGRSVALAPGGYHLMLIGPKRPSVTGGQVPVMLLFERAGTVRVDFEVRVTPPASTVAEGKR